MWEGQRDERESWDEGTSIRRWICNGGTLVCVRGEGTRQIYIAEQPTTQSFQALATWRASGVSHHDPLHPIADPAVPAIRPPVCLFALSLFAPCCSTLPRKLFAALSILCSCPSVVVAEAERASWTLDEAVCGLSGQLAHASRGAWPRSDQMQVLRTRRRVTLAKFGTGQAVLFAESTGGWVELHRMEFACS